MSVRVAGLLLALAACGSDQASELAVDVVRVAPPQLTRDSLEVTPRLSTTPDAPERGHVALSIEIGMRNASGTTRRVPRIAFRAVPEAGRDTAAWMYVITRRAVDSLRAGERADFGLSTAGAVLATAAHPDGVYRVEVVLGDSGSGALPLGRVRLRTSDTASPPR